ncbi:MAG: OmpH family outer membrane protein [Acidobacteriaceae bacterium]
MKRTLVLTLAAGLATSLLAAQTAPVAGAPAVASVPQANPTKVAIIVFEQAVVATNEGQRAMQDVQKKYEPKKTQIDAAGAEIEQLKKQAAALPANAPDEQRANLIKSIDIKEKHLNSDAEEASTAYQDDLQKAYGVVAQKVGQTAVKYAQDNGFTLLMNVGGSQNAPNPVLWFDAPKMDVTQAVINAYNASSGIAAPKPSAPSAAVRPRPAAARPAAPAATTPKK